MADVESMSHSGIPCPADVRAGKEWYETVLGAESHGWIGLNTDDLLHARGPHPCVIAEDFLFVIFPRAGKKAAADAPKRGINGARHAFMVPRARWDSVLERLRAEGVEFEGPLAHPERGPLGESVYFTDAIGNNFELCWRRDEDRQYHPVLRGGD